MSEVTSAEVPVALYIVASLMDLWKQSKSRSLRHGVEVFSCPTCWLSACLKQIGSRGILPHDIIRLHHMSRRITVESLPCIDVNELNRLGAFGCPMEYPFLGLRTSPQLIEYRDPKWPVDRPPQRIPIQWTRCTLGGSRPWLTCLCGRRVGKLYRGSAWLGCRHCAEATYKSQRKSCRGRLYLKATRIRARLGDYGRPVVDVIPSRPSGMQRRTYIRLRAQLDIIERKLIQGRIYRPCLRRNLPNYAPRA